MRSGSPARSASTDEPTLKGIEAAALLHDTGKLAVPEHILNKPGKLSEAEFEQMKRHVDVGADILSLVDFPYPVVPIVRCHHENWDGSGYPRGVAGTDIPIGARILSVVDCFDALTSDRPYRSALSTEAAFDILRARRGTMYEPLVVDTFIRVHRELVEPDGVVSGARRAAPDYALGRGPCARRRSRWSSRRTAYPTTSSRSSAWRALRQAMPRWATCSRWRPASCASWRPPRRSAGT